MSIWSGSRHSIKAVVPRLLHDLESARKEAAVVMGASEDVTFLPVGAVAAKAGLRQGKEAAYAASPSWASSAAGSHRTMRPPFTGTSSGNVQHGHLERVIPMSRAFVGASLRRHPS